MDRKDYLKKYGKYRNDIPFSMKTITSNLHSRYIPLYAMHNTYNKNNIDIVGIYVYAAPDIAFSSHVSKYSMTSIMETIEGEYSSGLKYFSNSNESVLIHAGEGVVLDEVDNILLLIVADVQNPVPQNDIIFLSYDFYKPNYKLLLKKIQEEIILPALQLGIEMRVVSSKKIKQEVFKPMFQGINEFETIEEYNKFLEEDLQKNYYEDEVVILKEEQREVTTE